MLNKPAHNATFPPMPPFWSILGLSLRMGILDVGTGSTSALKVLSDEHPLLGKLKGRQLGPTLSVVSTRPGYDKAGRPPKWPVTVLLPKRCHQMSTGQRSLRYSWNWFAQCYLRPELCIWVVINMHKWRCKQRQALKVARMARTC